MLKGGDMLVIAEFTIIPIGVGVSLSHYIAKCEQILSRSGLQYDLHANGTNIQGDWEVVFSTLKLCHDSLHAMGVPRIHSEIKVGTRTDRAQSMQKKIVSVQEKLIGT
jgi:uncharacterized protein (TIGR00106 family)